MENIFTVNIKLILEKNFGKHADEIFDKSQLIQYINEKTRSANKGSKSRSSFANLYAIYVIIEDYIANGYTKKRLPVELIYFKEYSRIDEAFYREKQVQHWSRKKKEALIEGKYADLPELAKKIWKRRKHELVVAPRYALCPTRRPAAV